MRCHHLHVATKRCHLRASFGLMYVQAETDGLTLVSSDSNERSEDQPLGIDGTQVTSLHHVKLLGLRRGRGGCPRGPSATACATRNGSHLHLQRRKRAGGSAKRSMQRESFKQICLWGGSRNQTYLRCCMRP